MSGSGHKRAAMLAATLALLLVAGGCGSLTAVKSPVTIRSDRRLKVLSPTDNDTVHLPVVLRWRVTDFPLDNGNQFGVYVDKAPVVPRGHLQWRVCTKREAVPPQIGENRGECIDERDRIFITSKTSMQFECFDVDLSAPKRIRDQHTITVVLLDSDMRRVGEASTSVTFKVDAKDSRRCRSGL